MRDTTGSMDDSALERIPVPSGVEATLGVRLSWRRPTGGAGANQGDARVDVDLLDLESSIKQTPGVLGCVILTDDNGIPTEIQAFTRLGSDTVSIETAIGDQVRGRGVDSLRQIFVFELDAESDFGDRESLERAAELAEQDARSRGPAVEPAPRAATAQGSVSHRARLRRVVLTSTHHISEAQVALGTDDEVVGTASGEKTPHGLKVLASAALEAISSLVGEIDVQLEGASLVNLLGKEAVMVLVRIDGQYDNVGAALVRQGPVSEAAVRATLDAVNRRLDRDQD